MAYKVDTLRRRNLSRIILGEKKIRVYVGDLDDLRELAELIPPCKVSVVLSPNFYRYAERLYRSYMGKTRRLSRRCGSFWSFSVGLRSPAIPR